MIDCVLLENFRAFGHPTRVPLAPITLLFGPNSAGKSSILHSLNLLKQTREAREPGIALLPRADEAISDLGSFRELVYDHDQTRAVTIGLGLRHTPAPRRGLHQFLLSAGEWIGLSLSFVQETLAQDVRLSELRLCWNSFDQTLAVFRCKRPTKEQAAEALRGGVMYLGRSTRPFTSSRLQLAARPVGANLREMEAWRGACGEHARTTSR